MEKLVRNLAWAPNAIDKTPAGKAKLKVYRTVHGLVTHYGTVNGKKVAYATARTTYLHEADSIMGFRRFNEPDRMSSPKKFQQSASKVQFTFNWAFQNAKHTAYYLSGRLPERAKGTSRTSQYSGPASTTGKASIRRTTRWTCWPPTAPADQEPSRDGLVEQQTSQGLVCIRSAVGLQGRSTAPTSSRRSCRLP